jgi:surface polysaccharide O-acyltransferase-like enzyme
MRISHYTSYWKWFGREYFQSYSLIGGGPLWFIETLLIFSLSYVIYRLVRRSQPTQPSQDGQYPANWKIVLFALLLGTASFLVRLVFPVNDTFRLLNLQFANFPQYIALFILGLVAYQRNWLTAMPRSMGRLWLGIAILIILIYGPLAVLAGAAENEALFLGGWHWQSLLFSLWDAFLCISMCTGLLSLFQSRLNQQGRIAHELSRSAYTAYLIHEPVITSLAMITASITLYPLLKFALTTILFIPVCFGLGSLVRRIPYLDRVL